MHLKPNKGLPDNIAFSIAFNSFTIFASDWKCESTSE